MTSAAAAPASDDDPNSPVEETPSEEDFLVQLETLFGSRDPDFDHFADLLHRRYKERKNAGEEEAANTIWKVHRVPLDVAYEASRRWDDLDPDTKRSVLGLLQTYEKKLDTLQQTSKLNE